MDAPSGTIILWKTASPPTGWSLYTAANNRFIRGITSGTAGTTSGASTHTHTAGAIITAGAHSHPSQSFSYNGASVNGDAWLGSGINIARNGHSHDSTFSLSSGGGHVHTLASASTGSGNNMPPYKVSYYIIKD